MVTIEQLAKAALRHDALQLRALALELLSAYCPLRDVPPPESTDPRVRATAAGLIELLALRQSEEPPSWSDNYGALDEPFHLLASAARMPRLRAQCERDSPAPLRKRNLYAPADFLTFA